ncbi:MAG: undecaprenyldiphospho-muramoylpentapeptide beta-N-acetylglucosaminyltransferase [Bacteroidetes bacterium]|nr:MAG: undecaprenyldiphospho-muramoylpentapeptide beta-N-acetylglucosaminyltransferase [Bacteroidota bacterium]
MNSQQRLRVIISGGGTGGHIFPAIAIANTLKKRLDHCDILFVGALGKMEMEKVPAAGYEIKGLWISGLQRKLTLKNLSFPFKVIVSLWKAKKIIKEFKPGVVIGVGGFASGPTLRAATALKIPTLIQEQNSFPGITNKILSKKVDKICVAYDGMEKYFPAEKIVKTGNPIRKEMVEIKGLRNEAIRFFNLKKDKKTLLIVGGSLGALSVNKGIHEHLELFVKNGLQLIWQTGNYYYETAKGENKDEIRVVKFIEKMNMAYAAADIIVSRAGAIAISEICAVHKPTIFVPLPSAAEDHQTKNAQALVDKDAACIVKDDEVLEKLGKTVIDLLQNGKDQMVFSENLEKLAISDAADRIVNEILTINN